MVDQTIFRGGVFYLFSSAQYIHPENRHCLKTSGSSVKLCIAFLVHQILCLLIWNACSCNKSTWKCKISLQFSKHIHYILSYPYSPCLPFVWLISFLLFSVAFILKILLHTEWNVVLQVRLRRGFQISHDYICCSVYLDHYLSSHSLWDSHCHILISFP